MSVDESQTGVQIQLQLEDDSISNVVMTYLFKSGEQGKVETI